jgi:hypothetical protein
MTMDGEYAAAVCPSNAAFLQAFEPGAAHVSETDGVEIGISWKRVGDRIHFRHELVAQAGLLVVVPFGCAGKISDRWRQPSGHGGHGGAGGCIRRCLSTARQWRVGKESFTAAQGFCLLIFGQIVVGLAENFCMMVLKLFRQPLAFVRRQGQNGGLQLFRLRKEARMNLPPTHFPRRGARTLGANASGMIGPAGLLVCHPQTFTHR